MHYALKLTACLGAMLLAGCSSYNQAFECKVAKGINCTSVSKINHMVDNGKLHEALDDKSLKPVKKEIIKIANKTPFPLVLSSNLHHSVVQRLPETTLRIWVAPYVSAKDGYIEAQYVHEVLTKGIWVEQRG